MHIAKVNRRLVLLIWRSLLIPIGQYRSNLESPSKGKRSKKRKRQTARAVKLPDSTDDKIPYKASAHPSPPSLMQYLDIGFNANTRHLEAMAQSSVPKALRIEVAETYTAAIEKDKCPTLAVEDIFTRSEALVAIFVPRSDQPALMHGHLPLLVHTASLARPSSPAIRLVGLPRGAEARLSSVLGIPRTGIIGLRDNAPYADSLIEMIRVHIPVVEVPWLPEIKAGQYFPVNINVMSPRRV